MKESAKVFGVIAMLLLGCYWAWDGIADNYYRHSEPTETVGGLLLVAVGLTAIWLRYGKKTDSK